MAGLSRSDVDVASIYDCYTITVLMSLEDAGFCTKGCLLYTSGTALFTGSKEQRERWSLLVDSVRTGKSIVPAMHGKEGFEYLAEEPEHAELFNRFMTCLLYTSRCV